MPDILQMVLAGVTAIAAVSDLRWRIIPNWLVLGGLILGFGLNVYLFGWNGLLRSSLGFGLAAVVYLPLFALRAMGGGDVKLMAAVGSIAGASHWFTIFLFTSILGGILALLLIMLHGNLSHTFDNIAHILRELSHLRPPHFLRPELSVDHPKAVGLPHGTVIGAGTLLFLLVLRFG